MLEEEFREKVSMYINDCMQYLIAARWGRRVNMVTTRFQLTTHASKIIVGLMDLKDLCIQVYDLYKIEIESKDNS